MYKATLQLHLSEFDTIIKGTNLDFPSFFKQPKMIWSGDVAKLAKASIMHTRDLGFKSQLRQKTISYFVCVTFESKSVGCQLLSIVC
jgi:hypothetical protein